MSVEARTEKQGQKGKKSKGKKGGSSVKLGESTKLITPSEKPRKTMVLSEAEEQRLRVMAIVHKMIT
ncbi:MAG: hypothetical protein K2K57_09640 [Oscillospiraceae bacterium]|nr:hypothetical protein [Oscillospiraceae bacterium]